MWTPQVEPFFAAKSATYQNLADTGVVHLSGKMKRSSRVSPQSRNIASATFDESLRKKRKIRFASHLLSFRNNLRQPQKRHLVKNFAFA